MTASLQMVSSTKLGQNVLWPSLFWAAAPRGDEVLQNGEKFRPSILLYICPSVRLYVRTSPQASRQTPLAGPQTPLAGPQTSPASPQTSSASPMTPPTALRPLV